MTPNLNFVIATMLSLLLFAIVWVGMASYAYDWNLSIWIDGECRAAWRMGQTICSVAVATIPFFKLFNDKASDELKKAVQRL